MDASTRTTSTEAPIANNVLAPKVPLYRALARKLQAVENCTRSGNDEWRRKHSDAALALVSAYMPSGSGIDCGTKLLLDESGPDKLVFAVSYHHMNGGGYYDGWTEHLVIARPSLAYGVSVRITGRNRDDVKDYLGEIYADAVQQLVDEWEKG